MILSTDVTVLDEDWHQNLPDAAALCERVVRATLDAVTALPEGGQVEVSIVLAGDERVRALNRDYRGRDAATNVLSFVGDGPTGAHRSGPLLLGDVVLAKETVVREAHARGIDVADHTAHLIVHGVLHLLGYDHEEEAAAAVMESLEAEILAKLGIDDPYGTGIEAPLRRRAGDAT